MCPVYNDSMRCTELECSGNGPKYVPSLHHSVHLSTLFLACNLVLVHVQEIQMHAGLIYWVRLRATCPCKHCNGDLPTMYTWCVVLHLPFALRMARYVVWWPFATCAELEPGPAGLLFVFPLYHFGGTHGLHCMKCFGFDFWSHPQTHYLQICHYWRGCIIFAFHMHLGFHWWFVPFQCKQKRGQSDGPWTKLLHLAFIRLPFIWVISSSVADSEVSIYTYSSGDLPCLMGVVGALPRPSFRATFPKMHLVLIGISHFIKFLCSFGIIRICAIIVIFQKEVIHMYMTFHEIVFDHGFQILFTVCANFLYYLLISLT